MSSLPAWGVLAALCLLCAGQGQAQPVACGGDYVRVADDAETVAASAERPADSASATGQHRCLGALVDVAAASDGERQLACSAAGHALQLLGRCGISLRRPLGVEIRSEVRHPFKGAILGLLDVKRGRVLVTRQANVPSLVKDTPFARLPLRDFYRSLIVHEVVHGVMHQNQKRPLTSHAEAEYPAYALQIESLPPDLRDKFLRSFDQAATKAGALLFNDVVLSADPRFFAASAYRHFKALDNGCGHLHALLNGEALFIATMPAGW
jgi:hypothetical protein